MKESNTPVGNATIKQHPKEILLNTKEQYMKESNSLVGNATIKEQKKEILLDTKAQFMKESKPNLVFISEVFSCFRSISFFRLSSFLNLGAATIVQGTFVQGDSSPRDISPMTQLSKQTIVQENFCSRRRLPVKSLLKLIFLFFSIETYHI